MLSSAHAAKGSEFDVVFVLDETTSQVSEGTDQHADRTRALYVALTRARHDLYIVAHAERSHPVFRKLAFLTKLREAGVKRFEVPPISLPEAITFSLPLEPGDLYLSAQAVVQCSGRQAVDTYARTWSDLGLRLCSFADGRVHFEFWTERGIVAQTIKFKPGDRQVRQTLKRLHQLHTAAASLSASGRMVMRCERDDFFYGLAQYNGPETHHHLVLPTITISRRP